MIVANRIFLVAMQTILLLIANYIGHFAMPFQIKQDVTFVDSGIFLWDGVLCVVGVYIVILLIEVLCRRSLAAAVGSTIALVLAAILGYWSGLDAFTPWGGII
jgi:uncharacterized membrane protein